MLLRMSRGKAFLSEAFVALTDRVRGGRKRHAKNYLIFRLLLHCFSPAILERPNDFFRLSLLRIHTKNERGGMKTEVGHTHARTHARTHTQYERESVGGGGNVCLTIGVLQLG